MRPSLFCRIADGSKTFLVATNESGFQLGDTLDILEWDDSRINSTSDSEIGLTGKKLEFKVGYVLPLSDALQRVVLSLLPVPKTKSK